MREAQPNLKDHSIESLRERFAAEGIEPWRAEQVSAWLYARGVEDPALWTDVSAALRERFAAEWERRALEWDEVAHSADGTVKGRLRARDGALVEAVVIPAGREAPGPQGSEPGERNTLCISTQVGCPLACSFCATGALGFTRNLTVAEILDQVCRMKELLAPAQRITNVVYMGMGEPLLNLPNVIESVRVLLHPKAFALGPRKVTVSTAGVVPKLGALLAAVPVNLAVSLHSPRDEVRDELVPINRRFPLETLMATLAGLDTVSARRPVFFEYTLMRGKNDSIEDARRLVRLLRRVPSKLNLIPMNPHPDAPYQPPEEGAIERFAAEIARGGITVTVRRPRGSDIAAACGQLANRSSAPGAEAPHFRRSEPKASGQPQN